jgi:hypothetical protein
MPGDEFVVAAKATGGKDKLLATEILNAVGSLDPNAHHSIGGVRIQRDDSRFGHDLNTRASTGVSEQG